VLDYVDTEVPLRIAHRFDRLRRDAITNALAVRKAATGLFTEGIPHPHFYLAEMATPLRGFGSA